VKNVLRRLKSISGVLMLGASCALIMSCGTDHSKVRLVHASPDALGLDVAVDGKTVATNLTFGGLSPASDYLTLTAGNHRVEFRSTETTDDLINATVGFASQTEYTLLAVELSPAPPANTPPAIAALLKTDDNSPPQSGNIKVRVIHSAPDPVDMQKKEPAHVDVYIVPPGTDITNATPAIASLGYQQASDYENVAAATYEIIVTQSTDLTKARLIDQNYDLTTGQIRTLVTVDIPGGGAMSGTPLELSDLN
jgi:hypothetical protein